MPDRNESQPISHDNIVRISAHDLLDVAKHNKWLATTLLLLLLAACNSIPEQTPATATPAATPDAPAVSTVVPNSDNTPAASATATLDKTPTPPATKEASPTPMPAQLIEMSQASGGAGIVVTPEGSQALSAEELKITQIFTEMNVKAKEKIEEMLKGMSGNRFLVSNEMTWDIGEGVAGANRVFTVLRDDGSIECIVTQAYTVTYSYDAETSIPIINNVEVGKQTVVEAITPEMEDAARLAIEEKLGRKLKDDEKVKMGVLYDQNTVVAGVVSEGASTDYSLMVPDTESVANGEFSNRNHGDALDAKSVVNFTGERFSFPGMQNPEIARDEHGYIEVFDNFWFKSTDPHTDDFGALPNNLQINPDRPEVSGIMAEVMNTAMAKLVGYSNVEAFMKDVEAGKTFKLKTPTASFNETTGNWEVNAQGELAMRKWDPSLGIRLTYRSDDKTTSHYRIHMSNGYLAFGLTEEGQLVVQTSSHDVENFWQVTETNGANYSRLASSSIMFALEVMAANGSLVDNVTAANVDAVLAFSHSWTPALLKNADGTIKPDPLIDMKIMQ